MTPDVASLIRSAITNQQEETPIGVLADALDEGHPNGRDGRATMLRKWFTDPESRHEPRSGNPIFSPTHTEIDPPDYVGAPHAYIGTHFLIPVYDRRGMNSPPDAADPNRQRVVGIASLSSVKTNPASRLLGVSLTPEEARGVADHHPNGQKLHQWLDQHFGPDTRAEKFCTAMGQVLKGTGRR
jgi:hypothetical protein